MNLHKMFWASPNLKVLVLIVCFPTEILQSIIFRAQPCFKSLLYLHHSDFLRLCKLEDSMFMHLVSDFV